MFPVRQSTAFETAIGPVLDADGVAVTDCVVGDFKIKKTTGNFAALNGSATLTHVSAGVYDLVLTTSDTDTVGLNCVAIDDTVNACQSVYLQVMEEAIYDALYAASANAWSGAAGSSIGTANVTQFGGSNGTFSGGRAEVNMTHIAGSAVSTSTAQLGVNVVNFGGSAGTFSSGRPEVNASHISGSSTAADNVEVVYATDFATNYSTSTDKWQVESNVTHIAGTAWASTTLFTLASHDPGTTIGTSTLTQTQVTGGAYALNSASFAFNAAVNNAIADQVWDEDATGHQTTGTFGKAIGDPGLEGTTIWETVFTNLDATVSSRASSSALATAQANLDTITGANGVIIATGTQTFNMTGSITGNLSGSVGSVTGAVGSVTGNVGGNVVGSVASVTGNVGGNVVGSVASVTGAVGSVTGNLGGSVGSVTGGINTGSGVITTFDALDTAQDTQHGTTRTKLLKYTQLLARKDAAIATDNATELAEINANGGSGAGSYANTDDAQQAIRDRGDAAWTTGGGGGGGGTVYVYTATAEVINEPLEAEAEDT